MFKSFFTYERTSFAAEILAGVLIIAAAFRALFSPAVFDQAVNGLLFILAFSLGLALWKILRWTDRERTKMKDVLRLRSEFIDFASFQLRTPSSALMSGLSLLKEGAVDKMSAEEKTAFISNLYRRSEQLGQVIRDILQASEFDTKKINFADKHLTVIDAGEMVEKIRQNYDQMARDKGLDLSVRNEATTVTVKTFADYLEEAVGNLVENAIRFTNQGRVTIVLRNRVGRLLIEVTDTGIGIAPTDIPLLFERYTRGQNAIATYPEGVGLGLFLAKEIVSAHKGGELTAQSVLGQGSIFTISLPTA